MKKKLIMIILTMAVATSLLGGCGRESAGQVTDTLAEGRQPAEGQDIKAFQEQQDIEALKKQFARDRKYHFAGIDESQLNVGGDVGEDGAADEVNTDTVDESAGSGASANPSVGADSTNMGSASVSMPAGGSNENRNTFSGTAHLHSYETITVDATCTAAGYTEEKCSCGDVRNHRDIPADGHYYEEKWFLAPTCLSGGYVNYVCSKCGGVDESRSGNGSPLPHTVAERMKSHGDCASNTIIEQYCTSCQMVVGTREEPGADIHDWRTDTYEVWDEDAFAMVEKTETYCPRCGRVQ